MLIGHHLNLSSSNFKRPVSGILEKRKNELVKILPDWKNAEDSGLFAENFFMDNRLKDMVEETMDLYKEAGEISRIGSMKPENQTFRCQQDF